MPKPPLLWPERQRCTICRKKFRWVVLYRKYCSYECAALEPPDPYLFPRCCFRKRREGEKVPAAKKTFFSLEQAMDSFGAHADPRLEAYWCRHCHMVHLGHSPRPVVEEDPEEEPEIYRTDWSYRFDWIYIRRRKKQDRQKHRRRPSEVPPEYPKEYRHV